MPHLATPLILVSIITVITAIAYVLRTRERQRSLALRAKGVRARWVPLRWRKSRSLLAEFTGDRLDTEYEELVKKANGKTARDAKPAEPPPPATED